MQIVQKIELRSFKLLAMEQLDLTTVFFTAWSINHQSRNTNNAYVARMVASSNFAIFVIWFSANQLSLDKEPTANGTAHHAPRPSLIELQPTYDEIADDAASHIYDRLPGDDDDPLNDLQSHGPLNTAASRSRAPMPLPRPDLQQSLGSLAQVENNFQSALATQPGRAGLIINCPSVDCLRAKMKVPLMQRSANIN